MAKPRNPPGSSKMEQKNLPEAALAFYEAFRRSNDVMFYCNKEGVILDVNDAFCRHYGYQREEVIGQNPRILRSRFSTDELYKRMWASILDPDKGYWRGEMVNRTKSGAEIPLILTITAVKDAEGKIVGYVSNAIDMSNQHALQQRVAHSEALASLGEMAAVMAHEIRNPLGSIVMASRQLAGSALDPADRESVVQILRVESQRLNEVLSNFLTYARPRELKLARADLDGLVKEVCAMADRKVETRTGGLKPANVDADQVRQVIWNLVNNALQAAKSRVVVATEGGGGWVRVIVSDDGPGIQEADLAKIFKPFHTTKNQGTGLGLPIAQRIAMAHGGRVELAKSALLGGAEFILWLPSAEA